MPSLNLKIDHALSRDEAAERVRRLVEFAKAQYGHQVSNLSETWEEHAVEFAFSVMGMSTTGKLRVEETHVEIDSKLPFAAVMLRGRIEEAIKSQLGRILR